MSSQYKKEQVIIFNSLSDKINKSFESRFKQIKDNVIEEKLNNESLDITLASRPGIEINKGKIHPISRTIDEIISIFATFGFSV